MINGGGRIDTDKPLWDMNTFFGRVKHFFFVTDPRTVLTPTKELYAAKTLVEQYKRGEEPPGTTREQVIYAKKLRDGAFHPDTGDLQNVIGRMSCQVPGGMAITGVMMTFYRSNVAVVFWQWVNQSFNALVNYTNRNAASDITPQRIAVAYVSATTCALVAALGLKARLAKTSSPLLQRFVPFVAVACANMVNIPLMRQSEITSGIRVNDENGNPVAKSKYAAIKGISQVVLSRNFMACCTMCSIPLIMNRLERFAVIRRYTALHAPIQVLLCGVILTVAVPVGCAMFPQNCYIPTERLSLLDAEQLEQIRAKYLVKPEKLYFNKGL